MQPRPKGPSQKLQAVLRGIFRQRFRKHSKIQLPAITQLDSITFNYSCWPCCKLAHGELSLSMGILTKQCWFLKHEDFGVTISENMAGIQMPLWMLLWICFEEFWKVLKLFLFELLLNICRAGLWKQLRQSRSPSNAINQRWTISRCHCLLTASEFGIVVPLAVFR